MKALIHFFGCFCFFSISFGDLYLHNPRGSNNRLRERSAVRQNNNRLFNTQNNPRGGYNVGDQFSTLSSSEEQQYRMNYFQSGMSSSGNTELVVEWTAQHGCGGNENTSPHKLNCNMVLQFMCQDDIGNETTPDDSYTLRNGQDFGTQTYSKPQSSNETLATAEQRKNSDVRADRGLHESWEWYDSCYRRQRNKGLFTADQNLNVNKFGLSSAIFTRQSPNENRYGYECPEERDYYPYFYPTPWIDVAVLTDNTSRCDFYEQNSFNHRVYSECVEQFSPSGRKHWSTVTNAAACRQIPGAEWINYYSYLELAPQYSFRNLCLRQNNLQNRVTYMWGKPYDTIKIANHESIDDTCFVLPPPLDCKAADWSRVNHFGDGRDLTPINYTWILPYFPSENKKRCVLRLRYNISTDDYDPFSTDSSQNQIKVNNYISQRSPVEQNPLVDIGANGQLLKLAINTDQTGRTFQDRSHVFFLSPRPYEISQSARLLNLNVRGKRGNIVQVYPAVEYDFVPNRLYITEEDLVHIQWTGSNTHNNGNPAGDGASGDAGSGKAGSDRNNLLQMQHPADNYPTPFENSTLYQNMEVVWSSFGIYGETTEDKQRNAAIQLASSGYFSCSLSSECSGESLEEKNQFNTLLDNSPASFTGIVAKFKQGTYYYMCTRNNNFSNRSQKGMLVVS